MTLSLETDIGASLGVQAEVKVKASIRADVKFEITGFNPTHEAPGTNMKGSTLDVWATPNWKVSYTGAVGGGALVSVEVRGGADKPGNLNDIQATLDSECGEN